jgi:hypothetical protein
MILSTGNWTVFIEENGLIIYHFYEEGDIGEVSPGEDTRIDETREAVVQAIDALEVVLREIRR